MCKSLISLLVAVLPVAVLANETQAATAAGPIVIGVSIPGGGSPFHDSIKQEAEHAAATLGARIEVENASWDFVRQAGQISDGFVLTRHVQGILIDNCMSEMVVLAVESAANSGIPVATVGDVQLNSSKPLVHVGADNVAIGREAARFIIDKLGNRGSVIEIEGDPGWPSARDRKSGFDEVIKKSNVKLLTSISASWSRSTARWLVGDVMKKNQFDAVFAASDDMIIGAIEAMSDAKINPGTKVTVGVDATPIGLQYLRDGRLTATFDQLPSEQVGPAMQYLVGYINGKAMPPQKVILVKPRLVTKASLPGD